MIYIYIHNSSPNLPIKNHTTRITGISDSCPPTSESSPWRIAAVGEGSFPTKPWKTKKTTWKTLLNPTKPY